MAPDNGNYLLSVHEQLLYYKSLAEKAIQQIAPSQLFLQPSEEGNSIAIIIQHMAGNMLSRWSDFLTTDGEKEWRKRDAEFEPIVADVEELMELWNRGWQCVFTTLDSLRQEHLNQVVYIRNEAHTVVQAINRQLAHYPYHVGQIVFFAKELKGKSFVSLSIPRDKSQEFNAEKFSNK